MAGLLDGFRILDLSRVLAGPWAGQTLADLGAEVIKVERPGSGDDTRAWGPSFLEIDGEHPIRESAYYLSTNRGKKSVAIDIALADGQSLVRRLAEKCDVVIENFKFGGLAKYGLDWHSLSAINPRLVYCSITGFGQTGPYRDKLGYDFLIQGMGGLMSITGTPDGAPTKAGVAITDVFAGMYAATAILAALLERDRSGKGQHIDIALFDVQIATLVNQMMGFLVSGKQPPRLGNAHPSIVPYQSFEASDGTVLVAVGNDGQFERMTSAMEIPELARDARYRRNEDRVKNRDTLIPTLKSQFIQKPVSFWVARLNAADVPCGPVNSFADIERDEQVIARSILKPMQHPIAGSIRGVASPMRFSRSEVSDSKAAPMLSGDTDAVLRELLDASDDDIARWRNHKVIG